ncbi:hypothetical protein M3Y97_01048000 [Aphelenchoides bicaudatus]|nr:hypothetical protein M3Y97_01048000 [Aphelenchoides bicaudatus]
MTESVEGDRQMLHDAGWKKIQQNTFTRWVNQHLLASGMSITNLETDLSDGIKLIKLIEVLAGRPVTQRYNKKAQMRTQKVRQRSTSSELFGETRRNQIGYNRYFKLPPNLNTFRTLSDCMHIVDGNLKLIMGLIWTLILHYSISMNTANSEQPKGQTPKQRLLQWIRSRLPSDVPVTNFTSDWNDGMALGALVDALVPGACDNWRQWRPDDALENTKKAMQAAEQCLGIGRLITPEELINPNVDEKSVMTFLSQFPRADAPPKGRISGVDPEPVVNRDTHFLVEVEREGIEPIVRVVDSEGQELQVQIKLLDGSGRRFDVSYTPKKVGKHEITVHGAHEQARIKLGVFTVRAVPAPTLVDFKERVEVGEQQKFRLVNLTEKNNAEVLILDPRGNKLNNHNQKVGASIAYSFTPESIGLHSVNVFVDKRHIEGSPFALNAQPTMASNAVVWGRGVCSKGPRVGDQLPIPHDLLISSQQVADTPERKSFIYSPLGTGPHTVSITCNGQHLGQSPYKVDVAPKTNLAVRAVGPGLEGGVANEPAVFYVDTKGDANILEFSTEGPSQSEIQSVDNGDNTALVEYRPSKPGVYKVNVLNKGEHIKDSPFVIMIDPESTNKSQPKARIVTSESNSNDLRVGEPFDFFVESSKTPDIKVYDPDLSLVDRIRKTPTSKQSPDGLNRQKVSFVPHKPGKYVICAAEDKVAIDDTPFSIEVSKAVDLAKLHVYGPGVGANVFSGQTTSFAIDARDVGCKKIDVDIVDPSGQLLDPEVSQESGQPISVSYTPNKTGPHKAKIYVDGEQAFDVNVDVSEFPTARKSSRTSSSDASSERAYPPKQLSQTVAGQDASLHLMLNDVDPKHLTARMQCPDGRVESIPLKHAGGNHFTISFHPKQDGLHIIDVLHRGKPVEGSPFRIPVSLLGRPKAHLAKAEGTGLEFGQVGKKQSFIVYVGDAGGGELKASINGPSKAQITLTDYEDGVCKAEYSTDEPGLYTISLLLDDAPISGSPFKVFIAPASDPNTPSSPTASKHNGKNGRQLSSSEKSNSFSYDSNAYTAADNNEHYDRAAQIHQRALNELQLQENQPPQHQITTSEQQLQKWNEKDHSDLIGHHNQHSKSSSKYSYKTLSSDDVRKVTAEGSGLYEFVPGEVATFRVDTSKAGSSLLFVGIVTSKGPSEEVSVKHRGGGLYDVAYKIPDHTRALVLIKYGDSEMLGSPFTVRPASRK